MLLKTAGCIKKLLTLRDSFQISLLILNEFKQINSYSSLKP